MRSLQLVQKIAGYRFNTTANIEDLSEGIFQINGSITYAIVTQKYQPTKYFLVDSTAFNQSKKIIPKAIDQKIAEKLDDLGPATTLFTLDIWKNVAFIPYFREIASLEDILSLRDRWSFKQRHVKILLDDIIAGISSLHKFKLQKGSFSVRDILLVRRQDLIYFQIGKTARAVRKIVLTMEAGLEDCKCLSGNEPTDSLELQSFRKILYLVGGPNEADRPHLISELMSTLSGSQVLGSKELAAARDKVKMEDERHRAEHEEQRAKYETIPPWDKDIHRVELEVYFDAVRILGTILGGTFSKS